MLLGFPYISQHLRVTEHNHWLSSSVQLWGIPAECPSGQYRPLVIVVVKLPHVFLLFFFYFFFTISIGRLVMVVVAIVLIFLLVVILISFFWFLVLPNVCFLIICPWLSSTELSSSIINMLDPFLDAFAESSSSHSL